MYDTDFYTVGEVLLLIIALPVVLFGVWLLLLGQFATWLIQVVRNKLQTFEIRNIWSD